MYAGTTDGKDYGFYLDKDELVEYCEITQEEYNALFKGQGEGKVIVFHGKEKPTLEEYVPTEKEKAQEEIDELKQFLCKTDYVAIKIAEGEATSQDYSETLEKRRQARKRINELEEA